MRDNNNIFDPVPKPISISAKTQEKVIEEEYAETEKQFVEKQNSQNESAISTGSRCQYHASFVLKRPTDRKKETGIALESSQSFDSVHGCNFRRKKKPNQQDRYSHSNQKEVYDYDDSESHESAQYNHLCHFDPVMTWFRGAEDPHVNNKGSFPQTKIQSPRFICMHEKKMRTLVETQQAQSLYFWCIGSTYIEKFNLNGNDIGIDDLIKS